MGLYLGEEGWMRQGVWGLWPAEAPKSIGAKDKDERVLEYQIFHIDSTVVLFRLDSTVLISDANSDVPSFPVCTNDHRL